MKGSPNDLVKMLNLAERQPDPTRPRGGIGEVTKQELEANSCSTTIVSGIAVLAVLIGIAQSRNVIDNRARRES